jgi:hypothetical protein
MEANDGIVAKSIGIAVFAIYLIFQYFIIHFIYLYAVAEMFYRKKSSSVALVLPFRLDAFLPLFFVPFAAVLISLI